MDARRVVGVCLMTVLLMGVPTCYGRTPVDSLALMWLGNRIEFPSGDTVGEWKLPLTYPITIVQLGDSHVQADLSARATRMALSELMGIGMPARGFTFPFRVAKQNEPPDIRSSSAGKWTPIRSLGGNAQKSVSLAAIALETNEASSILAVRPNERFSPDGIPTRVSLLFDPNCSSLTSRLNGKTPDSTDWELGVAYYSFDEPPPLLRLSLQKTAGEAGQFRFLGFDLRSGQDTLLFHAAGLNGADMRTHLKNSFLPTQLRMLRPQIVILSLGTNDAYNTNFNPLRFEEATRQLVARIREVVPQALLVLMTPPDHLRKGLVNNPALIQVVEVLRKVAQEESVALWDFHRIMGGEGSVRSWYNNQLAAADHLHLSPAGYRLQGELMAIAIYRLLCREGVMP